MLQLEKVKQALKAVDELCGHCETCSPDCPVAIARRALQGLNYDLESMQEELNKALLLYRGAYANKNNSSGYHKIKSGCDCEYDKSKF